MKIQGGKSSRWEIRNFFGIVFFCDRVAIKMTDTAQMSTTKSKLIVVICCYVGTYTKKSMKSTIREDRRGIFRVKFNSVAYRQTHHLLGSQKAWSGGLVDGWTGGFCDFESQSIWCLGKHFVSNQTGQWTILEDQWRCRAEKIQEVRHQIICTATNLLSFTFPHFGHRPRLASCGVCRDDEKAGKQPWLMIGLGR